MHKVRQTGRATMREVWHEGKRVVYKSGLVGGGKANMIRAVKENTLKLFCESKINHLKYPKVQGAVVGMEHGKQENAVIAWVSGGAVCYMCHMWWE